MLKISLDNRFKKEYKKCIKRGCDQKKFETILKLLAEEKKLPVKYRDHVLIDNKEFKNVRELHISPDWLLIYKIDKSTRTLRLIRIGTHSDLFQSSSKSFTTLINTSYSIKDGWRTPDPSFDAGVLSTPISFIRGGYTGWDNASLSGQSGAALYVSLRSGNETLANGFYCDSTALSSQYSITRSYGMAVRCGSNPLQILHHSH